MVFYLILAFLGIILLFLIYKKLDKLSVISEQDLNNKLSREEQMNGVVGLSDQLHQISRKVTELSDSLTIENPPWGKNSGRFGF